MCIGKSITYYYTIHYTTYILRMVLLLFDNRDNSNYYYNIIRQYSTFGNACITLLLSRYA